MKQIFQKLAETASDMLAHEGDDSRRACSYSNVGRLARTSGGLIERGGGSSRGQKGRAKIREGKGMSVEPRWRSGKVGQEGMLGLGACYGPWQMRKAKGDFNASEYGVVLLTAFFLEYGCTHIFLCAVLHGMIAIHP